MCIGSILREKNNRNIYVYGIGNGGSLLINELGKIIIDGVIDQSFSTGAVHMGKYIVLDKNEL